MGNMTNKATELLPCPFDGYEGELFNNDEETPNDPYAEWWIVRCVHCGCTAHEDYKDKEEAIKAWNTRQALQPVHSTSHSGDFQEILNTHKGQEYLEKLHIAAQERKDR